MHPLSSRNPDWPRPPPAPDRPSRERLVPVSASGRTQRAVGHVVCKAHIVACVAGYRHFTPRSSLPRTIRSAGRPHVEHHGPDHCPSAPTTSATPRNQAPSTKHASCTAHPAGACAYAHSAHLALQLRLDHRLLLLLLLHLLAQPLNRLRQSGSLGLVLVLLWHRVRGRARRGQGREGQPVRAQRVS